MKYDLHEVTNGKFDGKEIWVCDYRWNDLDHAKAIRHIKPQKVLIRPNSETRKTIYVSLSHTVRLGKNGEVLKSKVIPIFDNTASYPHEGTALKMFDTGTECVLCYLEQCDKIIEEFKEHKIKKLEEIENRIQSVLTSKEKVI